MEPTAPPRSDPAVAPARSPVPLVIGSGVLALLVAGGLLIRHAESKVNHVALASEPKPVTVVEAAATSFRAQRAYVGRLDPWIAASVGPQFVSAYVDTVLVRPGASVKRGQVLATLDCRNANAMAAAVDMQARALDEEQRALSHESSRVTSMLDGGFVSPNEAEQKSAQSSAKEAELLAEKAKLVGTSLEVNDCILRAPFDGDVATRTIDPGAFVRPGASIVSIVDRGTVRLTVDVPENDFDVVVPGKPVRILEYATGKEISGSITRRAPAADASTRTVHVEVDIADLNREIPVGTTGELRVDVGAPIPATSIPLAAANVTDTKSTVFTVNGDTTHAKTFVALGESSGLLYAKPADLAPGTQVVTQGRSLLKDGDRVAAKLEGAVVGDAASPPAPSPPSSGATP
jgi:RND family efflux transporter MFP subunit